MDSMSCIIISCTMVDFHSNLLYLGNSLGMGRSIISFDICLLMVLNEYLYLFILQEK